MAGEATTIHTAATSTKQTSSTTADEIRLGISQYLKADLPGFAAVIKHRWEDFHVHEVDKSTNEVLHLSELISRGEVLDLQRHQKLSDSGEAVVTSEFHLAPPFREVLRTEGFFSESDLTALQLLIQNLGLASTLANFVPREARPDNRVCNAEKENKSSEGTEKHDTKNGDDHKSDISIQGVLVGREGEGKEMTAQGEKEKGESEAMNSKEALPAASGEQQASGGSLLDVSKMTMRCPPNCLVLGDFEGCLLRLSEQFLKEGKPPPTETQVWKELRRRIHFAIRQHFPFIASDTVTVDDLSLSLITPAEDLRQIYLPTCPPLIKEVDNPKMLACLADFKVKVHKALVTHAHLLSPSETSEQTPAHTNDGRKNKGNQLQPPTDNFTRMVRLCPKTVCLLGLFGRRIVKEVNIRPDHIKGERVQDAQIRQRDFDTSSTSRQNGSGAFGGRIDEGPSKPCCDSVTKTEVVESSLDHEGVKSTEESSKTVSESVLDKTEAETRKEDAEVDAAAGNPLLTGGSQTQGGGEGGDGRHSSRVGRCTCDNSSNRRGGRGRGRGRGLKRRGEGKPCSFCKERGESQGRQNTGGDRRGGGGGGPPNRSSAYHDRWPKDRPPYLRFRLYKINRDTAEAINMVAGCAGCNPKLFSYAGTKDRRGITVQAVTALRVSKEQLCRGMLHPKWDRSIRLSNFEYVQERSSLGNLAGNHFRVCFRGVDPSRQETCEAACRSLQTNGFINYFGLQRFGTRRVKTHDIGVALLKADWKRAARLILGDVSLLAEAEDFSSDRQAIEDLKESRKRARSETTEPVLDSRNDEKPSDEVGATKKPRADVGELDAEMSAPAADTNEKIDGERSSCQKVEGGDTEIHDSPILNPLTGQVLQIKPDDMTDDEKNSNVEGVEGVEAIDAAGIKENIAKLLLNDSSSSSRPGPCVPYLINGDAETALKHLPRYCYVERLLLTSLVTEPTDYLKAIRKLPKNSLTLYIHAVQSLLWNLTVSERIKGFGTSVKVGDMVAVEGFVEDDMEGADGSCSGTGEARTGEEENAAKGSQEEAAATEAAVQNDSEGNGETLSEKAGAEGREERMSRRDDALNVIEIATEEEAKKYTIWDVVYPLPGTEMKCSKSHIDAYDALSRKTLGVSLQDFSAFARFRLGDYPGGFRHICVRPRDMRWQFIANCPTGANSKMLATDVDRLLNTDVAQSDETTDSGFSMLLARVANSEAKAAADGETENEGTEKDCEKNDADFDKGDAKPEAALLLACTLPKSAYLTMACRELFKGQQVETGR